jgi:hypothetical protein
MFGLKNILHIFINLLVSCWDNNNNEEENYRGEIIVMVTW